MKNKVCLRTIGIILIATMVGAIFSNITMFSFSTMALAQGYGDKFLVPIGSPDPEAIKIYTAQDLYNIRDNPYGSYVLMNDIDLSSYNRGEWVPIEQKGSRISVEFDGQGHVIKNLKITSNKHDYYGLFGIADGSIKNVGIENIYICITKNGSLDAGGIVGRFSGNSIENCYSTGTILATTSSSFDSRAGGIVGDTYNVQRIKNCYSKTVVSSHSASSEAYAGGVVGYGNCGIVENCSNIGSISATTAGLKERANSYAGGIAGQVNSSALFTNCYNTGNVKSSYSYMAYSGGIIGGISLYHSSISMKNCYNTGTVTASSSSHSAFAGGIIGEHNSSDGVSSISLEVCYNTAKVSANSYRATAGGILGDNKGSATITNCFNMGNTKAFDANDSSSGGIIGQISSYSELTIITNCYNIGLATALANSSFYAAGGIAGSCDGETSMMQLKNCYYLNNNATAFGEESWSDPTVVNVRALAAEKMKQKTSYVGFNFNSIWRISTSTSGGYPYLSKLPAPEKVTNQDDSVAAEIFSYYVDQAVLFGLAPVSMNSREKVTLKDYSVFILNLLKYKCNFDVDKFLKSKGVAIPSDSLKKIVALHKLLGISIDPNISKDRVLTQEQIAYFLSEYVRVFMAPFSPLRYDDDAPFTRYSFYNYPYVIYSTKVISTIMSEMISLSQGKDKSKNSYSAKASLTIEQFAATILVLSTMSTPKDMSGKYPGGITTMTDIDKYVEKVLDKIIKPGMTANQKVKAIYLYMIKNYKHSDADLPWLTSNDNLNPLASECDLFMPILLNGKGTCDVFASGLRIFLTRLGFECNYVSGQYVNSNGKKSGHGWNQVKINNQWYWLDVDVEGTTFRKSGKKEPSYFLFLKQDSYWIKNHIWNKKAYPACDGINHPLRTDVNKPK